MVWGWISNPQKRRTKNQQTSRNRGGRFVPENKPPQMLPGNRDLNMGWNHQGIWRLGFRAKSTILLYFWAWKVSLFFPGRFGKVCSMTLWPFTRSRHKGRGGIWKGKNCKVIPRELAQFWCCGHSMDCNCTNLKEKPAFQVPMYQHLHPQVSWYKPMTSLECRYKKDL